LRQQLWALELRQAWIESVPVMPSVSDRLRVLDQLLSGAKAGVGYVRSLDGARNPLDSKRETVQLLETLKRAEGVAEKLRLHFDAQLRRKGVR
jgi:hypothetical protein